MEKNKYYTPIIEEFHVGFELYDKTLGIWTKRIIEDPEYMRIVYFKTKKTVDNKIVYDLTNEYRVKYLDQEDIESLGWESGNILVEYNKIDTFNKGNFCITTTMETYNKTRILDISWIGPFKNNILNRIFRGTIKNKSELKKLMKQLNII